MARFWESWPDWMQVEYDKALLRFGTEPLAQLAVAGPILELIDDALFRAGIPTDVWASAWTWEPDGQLHYNLLFSRDPDAESADEGIDIYLRPSQGHLGQALVDTENQVTKQRAQRELRKPLAAYFDPHKHGPRSTRANSPAREADPFLITPGARAEIADAGFASLRDAFDPRDAVALDYALARSARVTVTAPFEDDPSVLEVVVTGDSQALERLQKRGWRITPGRSAAGGQSTARASVSLRRRAPMRANPRWLAKPPFWHRWPQWMQVGLDQAMESGMSPEDAIKRVGKGVHHRLAEIDAASGIDPEEWEISINPTTGKITGTTGAYLFTNTRGQLPRAPFVLHLDPADWRTFRITWADDRARRLARQQSDTDSEIRYSLSRALKDFFEPAREKEETRIRQIWG